MPLSSVDIHSTLNEMAARMPKGHRTPVSVLSYCDNAALRDLPQQGKNYDLNTEQGREQAVRAIFALNTARLMRAYGYDLSADIARGAVSEKDALRLTLEHGARGAVPHLKKLSAAFVPPPTQAAPMRAADPIQQAPAAPMQDDCHSEESALPAAPSAVKQAAVSGFAALSSAFGSTPKPTTHPQQTEKKSIPTDVKLYDGIIDGHVCNAYHCSAASDTDIAAIEKKVQTATNDPALSAFQHVQHKSGGLDAKVAQALGMTSRATAELYEINEQFFAPSSNPAVLAPVRVHDLMQQPTYGYAKGRTGLRLEAGSHAHKTHHDDVLQNGIGVRVQSDPSTGLISSEIAGVANLVHTPLSTSQFHAVWGDQKALNAQNYTSFANSQFGMQTQATVQSLIQEAGENTSQRQATAAGTASAVFFMHRPEISIGAGPLVTSTFGGNQPQTRELSLRTEMSVLDPWSAKHGLRLVNDVTPQRLTGQLTLASERPKLTTSSYATRFSYNIQKNTLPTLELEMEGFKPLTPKTSLLMSGSLVSDQGVKTANTRVEIAQSLGQKGKWRLGGAAALTASDGDLPRLDVSSTLQVYDLARSWTARADLGLSLQGKSARPMGNISAIKFF